MKNGSNPDAELLGRVRGLADLALCSVRDKRYNGGGFDISVAEFHPDDQARLRKIYDATKKTYELWLYMREAPNYDLLARHLVDQFSEAFATSVHQWGFATMAENRPAHPMLHKVLHDIRGGALVGLTGYASMLATLNPDPAERKAWVEIATLMSRDHAKLIRNAVPDLDPLVREADEGLKIHDIDDFVRKWQRSMLGEGPRRAQVTVHCDFHGSITNRCLETSAIDRVLYNYINNAARFTADGRIDLVITAINPGLVRWAVTNAIGPDQQAWLTERFQDDLRPLFFGGQTRGGHGIGLSNCADFVAASCGKNPRSAVDEGYLGARVRDAVFYAWFHWPSYQPEDPSIEKCAC